MGITELKSIRNINKNSIKIDSFESRNWNIRNLLIQYFLLFANVYIELNICSTKNTTEKRETSFDECHFYFVAQVFSSHFSGTTWKKRQRKKYANSAIFFKTSRFFSLSLFSFAKHIICINSLSIKILRPELKCRKKIWWIILFLILRFVCATHDDCEFHISRITEKTFQTLRSYIDKKLR